MSSDPRLIRRELKFERDFVQLPNKWMRDEELSYRARGLLAMLMTQKAGYMVTLKALASGSPREGLDALRAAVQELEEAGYIRRSRKQARGGQFTGDDWEILDPHQPVDNTLLTALDEPTRNVTALDEPTRTALDKPTPVRTLKNTLKRLPNATTVRELAAVDNSSTCPRVRGGKDHLPDAEGVCFACMERVSWLA